MLLSKFGNSIKYKTMIYELGKSEVRKSFIDLKIDTKLTLTADPKPRMLQPPKGGMYKPRGQMRGEGGLLR